MESHHENALPVRSRRGECVSFEPVSEELVVFAAQIAGMPKLRLVVFEQDCLPIRQHHRRIAGADDGDLPIHVHHGDGCLGIREEVFVFAIDKDDVLSVRGPVDEGGVSRGAEGLSVSCALSVMPDNSARIENIFFMLEGLENKGRRKNLEQKNKEWRIMKATLLR